MADDIRFSFEKREQVMGQTPSKENFILRNSAIDIPINISPQLLSRLADQDVDAEARVAKATEQHKRERLVHESRSADLVREEAEELLRRLKPVPAYQPHPLVVEAEAAVMECYKNNAGRTLNCWKQVQDFKAVETKLTSEWVPST